MKYYMIVYNLCIGGHSHSEKAAKATHQQLHELHGIPICCVALS